MSSNPDDSSIPVSRMAITDLTVLPTIIFATTAFVLIWSWIKRYVATHGPFEAARTVTSLNSKIYSVFSLGLAIAIARSVMLGEDGKELGELCRYTYHFSKIYEYVDVWFLVASGHVIGKHFAFHHITTPFLTYFRVLHASDWQVFAFLNCIHHFLMYGYFGGATFFKPALLYTQILQLGGGAALDALYLIQHGTSDTEEATGRTVCLLLLLRYAQLYYEELQAGASETAGKKKDAAKKE